MTRDVFTAKMFRRLFVPSLCASFGLALSEMADALVVGRSMGATGLAAIGMTLPLFMVINLLMHGFGIGGSVRYAQLMGAGKEAEALESFRQVLQAGLAAGVLLAAAVNLFPAAVLGLLGAAGAEAALYGQTMAYATPTQIFAGGVAAFLTTVGLPQGVVYTLINLAVSAFALTSLDSVARVGRLSFQELFLDESIRDEDMGPVRRVLTNKYFATVLTLALAYLLSKAGYASIWPLFGASNQLLSALAITIWNLGSGIAGGTYRWVSGMTVTVDGASVLTAWGAGLQLLFAVLILALGVVVVIQGVRKLLEKAPAAR